MPCSPLATSVSAHRRSPSLLTSPPPVAAVLDLSQPGERQAHDLVRRFASGRWPLWRLLSMRRVGHSLLAAVQWSPGSRRIPGCFAVVAVSLTEVALSWLDFPGAGDARRALAKLDANLLRIISKPATATE